MRVVVKRVGCEPEVVEIEHTLKAMQAIVGGYIETVTSPGLALVCNEEGKLKGLPNNFLLRGDIIVGDAFFVGIDPDTLDFCSLSDHAVYSIMRRFNVMGWYS